MYAFQGNVSLFTTVPTAALTPTMKTKCLWRAYSTLLFDSTMLASHFIRLFFQHWDRDYIDCLHFTCASNIVLWGYRVTPFITICIRLFTYTVFFYNQYAIGHIQRGAVFFQQHDQHFVFKTTQIMVCRFCRGLLQNGSSQFGQLG